MENGGKKESLEAAFEKQNEQLKKTILGDEENDKEYQDTLDYIYGLIKKDIKDEYLVNGAILSCEKATGEEIVIDGIPFLGGRGNKTKLVVSGKGKIAGKATATIMDCKKEINIFPFGNCLAKLPDQIKEELKFNQQARIEGTCKYLMRLEKRWENVIEVENDFFCFEGSPVIKMSSVLFCNRGGAFIYPLTSGQRATQYDYEMAISELSKEDFLLIHKYQLTLDEYKIGQELGLEERQLNIFKEIREYFEDVPSLKEENVIFAFEGLGSYSGETNSDHPNGQFGAIFIYCENGEIVCMSDNCSTLPDHVETATIKDGIYYTVYKLHNGVYQALQLWTSKTDQTIPACYHDKENKQADNRRASGINIHAAGDLKERASQPWSMGCLTVSVEDYYDFGVNAGFIEQRDDGNAYDTYKSIRDLKNIVQPKGTYWGYVVVNREYMDKEDRERFLTGYEDEAGK